MVLNKGGYVIINKALDNVYELAKNALTSGKPILWYETNTECYFIDTLTLSGTDIILTKGGKTITIESDGDITETGSITPQEKFLYKHSIKFQGLLLFDILNASEDELTYDDIAQYLVDNGYKTSSNENLVYSVNTGPGQCDVYGVSAEVLPPSLTRLVVHDDGTSNSTTMGSSYITDTVTPL